MKRQAGFTLIELVMVIVILGILSAFALPRFADLGNDARKATLEGALSSVKSASAIGHAEALVSGNTGAGASITMEGQTITMEFGYPSADAAAGIAIAAQLTDDFDVALASPATTPASVTITAKQATTAANCRFTYTEAADASTPSIISAATTTGC